MTTTDNLRWRSTNAPLASSRTDDIWFLDENIGWAVNSNGHILKTTDGWDTWQRQAQLSSYLRCVGFANSQRGWVGAIFGPRFFETSDGGANWSLVEELPDLAPSAICGLSVVDESVVYASGTNFPSRPARMMKTTDGGETWTAWEMGDHAALLVDTFFTSPLRGWVVGGKRDDGDPNPSNRNEVKPVVLFTDDGGATWENRLADIHGSLLEGEWGWKIQFLNDQIGFVSLESFQRAAILKTTDGGQSWTRIPVEVSAPNENRDLEGIGFVDENHGWVGGWSRSSETLDSGASWEDANEIGEVINRFRFFGNPVSLGYASGKTVYKYSADPIPTPELAATAPSLKLLKTNDPAEFVKSVTIDYTVPAGAKELSIQIWDRFGEHVCCLLDQQDPPAGEQSIDWSFKNDAGDQLPPGFYIYRINTDDEAESRVISLK